MLNRFKTVHLGAWLPSRGIDDCVDLSPYSLYSKSCQKYRDEGRKTLGMNSRA